MQANARRQPLVRLSNDIMEHVSLQKATLVRPGATLYSQLEECMRAAGFAAPWPKHWQDMLSKAVATSGSRGSVPF